MTRCGALNLPRRCGMQAVSDVQWRRFMNYDGFLACQALLARGTSNDKGEASNTQVGCLWWPAQSYLLLSSTVVYRHDTSEPARLTAVQPAWSGHIVMCKIKNSQRRPFVTVTATVADCALHTKFPLP
jgi:hypothetical protein